MAEKLVAKVSEMKDGDRRIVFVGDQMGDFPEADEGIANAGTDPAFGDTCFLLPQTMYGEWVTRVTRTLP